MSVMKLFIDLHIFVLEMGRTNTTRCQVVTSVAVLSLQLSVAHAHSPELLTGVLGSRDLFTAAKNSEQILTNKLKKI